MILLMQPHPNNKWFTGDLVRACSQMRKNPLKKTLLGNKAQEEQAVKTCSTAVHVQIQEYL